MAWDKKASDSGFPGIGKQSNRDSNGNVTDTIYGSVDDKGKVDRGNHWHSFKNGSGCVKEDGFHTSSSKKK